MDNADVKSKLIAYGTEFLKSYTNAIDTNFPGTLDLVRELDMEVTYFPLYGRSIGNDLALAVLFTSSDFYMGSGHEMQIAVLSWSWGTRYPTPWWIRFPRPDAALEKAVRTLTDDPRFPLIEVDGDLMALAESPQVCSSVFLTWWRGYCSGRRVPVVACRSVSARAWWWRSR